MPFLHSYSKIVHVFASFHVKHAFYLLIFHREVDFFNLKTYDLHGHWNEPLTADHHSPLVGGDELSPEPRDSVVGSGGEQNHNQWNKKIVNYENMHEDKF